MATTSLPALQASLKNTFNTIFPTSDSPELDAKIDQLCQQMASDIDTYIQDIVSKISSGTPAVVAPGIPVVAGSPPGPGATTAPGQATIPAGGLTTN